MAINYNDSNKFMATVSFYQGYVNHLWDVVSFSNYDEDFSKSDYNDFCFYKYDNQKFSFHENNIKTRKDNVLFELFDTKTEVYNNIHIKNNTFIHGDIVCHKDAYLNAIHINEIDINGDVELQDVHVLGDMTSQTTHTKELNTVGSLVTPSLYTKHLSLDSLDVTQVTAHTGYTQNVQCNNIHTHTMESNTLHAHNVDTRSLQGHSLSCNTISMHSHSLTQSITQSQSGSTYIHTNTSIKNNSFGDTNTIDSLDCTKDLVLHDTTLTSVHIKDDAHFHDDVHIKKDLLVDAKSFLNVATFENMTSSFIHSSDVFAQAFTASSILSHSFSTHHATADFVYANSCTSDSLQTHSIQVCDTELHNTHVDTLTASFTHFDENVSLDNLFIHNTLTTSAIELDNTDMHINENGIHINSHIHLNSHHIHIASSNIHLQAHDVSISSDCTIHQPVYVQSDMIMNSFFIIHYTIPNVTDTSHVCINNSPVLHIHNSLICDTPIFISNSIHITNTAYFNDIAFANDIHTNLQFQSLHIEHESTFSEATLGKTFFQSEFHILHDCIVQYNLFAHSAFFSSLSLNNLNAQNISSVHTQTKSIEAHNAYLHTISLNNIEFFSNSRISLNSFHIHSDSVVTDAHINLENVYASSIVAENASFNSFHITQNTLCSHNNSLLLLEENGNTTCYGNTIHIQNIEITEHTTSLNIVHTNSLQCNSIHAFDMHAQSADMTNVVSKDITTHSCFVNEISVSQNAYLNHGHVQDITIHNDFHVNKNIYIDTLLREQKANCNIFEQPVIHSRGIYIGNGHGPSFLYENSQWNVKGDVILPPERSLWLGDKWNVFINYEDKSLDFGFNGKTQMRILHSVPYPRGYIIVPEGFMDNFVHIFILNPENTNTILSFVFQADNTNLVIINEIESTFFTSFIAQQDTFIHHTLTTQDSYFHSPVFMNSNVHIHNATFAQFFTNNQITSGSVFAFDLHTQSLTSESAFIQNVFAHNMTTIECLANQVYTNNVTTQNVYSNTIHTTTLKAQNIFAHHTVAQNIHTEVMYAPLFDSIYQDVPGSTFIHNSTVFIKNNAFGLSNSFENVFITSTTNIDTLETHTIHATNFIGHGDIQVFSLSNSGYTYLQNATFHNSLSAMTLHLSNAHLDTLEVSLLESTSLDVEHYTADTFPVGENVFIDTLIPHQVDAPITFQSNVHTSDFYANSTYLANSVECHENLLIHESLVTQNIDIGKYSLVNNSGTFEIGQTIFMNSQNIQFLSSSILLSSSHIDISTDLHVHSDVFIENNLICKNINQLKPPLFSQNVDIRNHNESLFTLGDNSVICKAPLYVDADITTKSLYVNDIHLHNMNGNIIAQSMTFSNNVNIESAHFNSVQFQNGHFSGDLIVNSIHMYDTKTYFTDIHTQSGYCSNINIESTTFTSELFGSKGYINDQLIDINSLFSQTILLNSLLVNSSSVVVDGHLNTLDAVYVNSNTHANAAIIQNAMKIDEHGISHVNYHSGLYQNSQGDTTVSGESITIHDTVIENSSMFMNTLVCPDIQVKENLYIQGKKARRRKNTFHTLSSGGIHTENDLHTDEVHIVSDLVVHGDTYFTNCVHQYNIENHNPKHTTVYETKYIFANPDSNPKGIYVNDKKFVYRENTFYSPDSDIIIDEKLRMGDWSIGANIFDQSLNMSYKGNIRIKLLPNNYISHVFGTTNISPPSSDTHYL